MKQILKSLELIQDGETTITILPEDYLEAKYYDPCNCPMARAMKRTLGAVDVKFGAYTGFIDDCALESGEGAFQCYLEGGFTKEDHVNLLKSGGSLKRKLTKV